MDNLLLVKVLDGVYELHSVKFYNVLREVEVLVQQSSQLATLNELHGEVNHIFILKAIIHLDQIIMFIGLKNRFFNFHRVDGVSFNQLRFSQSFYSIKSTITLELSQIYISFTLSKNTT